MMRLDAFKQGLQSITDSAKEALEIFKPAKEALQGEVIDTQLTTLENKVDHKENLKENPEYITAFTEYLKEVLTYVEVETIGDIFAGDTLADQLSAFVSEQIRNNKQFEGGNPESRDALQKAFDIKDGTTNIQTVLEEFYAQYTQTLGTGTTLSHTQIQSLTDHYKKIVADKENVQKRKSEYATHNMDYRAKTKPTPTIKRYQKEQQSKKESGLAYDVSTETDPLKKTPQAILNRFTSSGYRENPATGVTLCAQTTRLDAERLFHLNLPRGNAFDVMRSAEGGFSASVVSKLYDKKEQAKKRIDSVHKNWDLGKNDYVNTLAPTNTNVADLYVTSSTPNGKKYGHRALMFRVAKQWYVLDPYTAIQSGEDKNKPRTLESYAKSMQTGRKREFMRMNFYQAPVNLEA